MDPAIEAALRGALALLFAVAARHKARDLDGFRATLAEYRLLPEGAASVAARLVIVAEVAASVALLVPVLRAPGPFLAAGLLAVYTGAIAINLARGRRDIDCGCAGPALRQPLSGWLLGRNGILLAAALACLVPLRPRPLVWVDALTVTGAVAALAAFYGALDRLVANAPRLAHLRERT